MKKAYTSRTRQHWSFVPINTGNTYVVVNRETQLAVNNEGGGTDNGNGVLSWTNDAENMFKNTRQWRIEKDEPKEADGIADVEQELQYVVLYNPDTKQVHFEAEDRSRLVGDAVIYDDGGGRVMQFALSQTANLSTVKEGIYILVWTEGGRQRSVKIAVK